MTVPIDFFTTGHSCIDAQTTHHFPRNMPQKSSFQEQVTLSNISREGKKKVLISYIMSSISKENF